ncbi:hypothetical protein R7D64_05920 [Vibrio sp. Vb2535]|uniref:hypothetical protein n=1 Tax=Vibrio TaxID=662 RepID=UPI001AD8144F|nr:MULTISPECIES: hypothetical protein [Vibrio]ELA6587503.1 hypothetical protein [Vibrio alginolyticus]ELA7355818.1 hypothetical protein [Vibrio alginolyticus]MDF5393004.1 hypothetical protein [Vibrio parahaemolyticus]MDF5398970.1 hypothetical protein [Vibrio parahaemolyticus]MDF5409763.1 hypothetical protein [Vibrio parahaemolyticus]
MATTKAKTPAAKAKENTKDSATTSEVKAPIDATTQEGATSEPSDQQTQTQGDAKSPKDPEPEPQVQQSQASPMPPEASNDEVQVKLKMPLWDSLKQRSFTINDLYPCSEKEAQRLIENGTAVKADA